MERELVREAKDRDILLLNLVAFRKTNRRIYYVHNGL